MHAPRFLRNLEELWIRPRSRANELASLRLRFLAEPTQAGLPANEVELAQELRHRREVLVGAFAGARACATCAQGLTPPQGRWTGGLCCSRATEALFSQQEIAALRAAGTETRHLQTPWSDHAGCAFRGPRGCTLQPGHRPGLCVRHLCPELVSELKARGDLPCIKALCAEHRELFAQFVQLRQSRLERTREMPAWREERSG